MFLTINLFPPYSELYPQEAQHTRIRSHFYLWIFQIAIFESKIIFLTLAPSIFIIIIDINALLIIFCNRFGFFMTLKPGWIFFVESPWLFPKFSCCQIPMMVFKLHMTYFFVTLTADMCLIGSKRYKTMCLYQVFHKAQDYQIWLMAVVGNSWVYWMGFWVGISLGFQNQSSQARIVN